MFEATYLGNQGWLFAAEGGTVLVDPLFEAEFGRGPAGARYQCHPPRSWTLEELPPIDALVMTHEHEDHLNIPTLAQVDRRVPVYLSSRASRAAHTVVRELGFDVTPLAPGARLTFGGISLRTFTPDHLAVDEIDEWDTLGFAAWDTAGDGAFFTNVDVHVTPEMADWVRREGEARGGDARTLLFYAGRIGEVHSLAALDRAGDAEHVAEPDGALARLADGRSFWPVPGLVFRMERRRTTAVRHAAFLRTPPLSAWPTPEALGFVENASAEDTAACGRRLFDERDLPRLTGLLSELATFLYGRTLFRRLYSLRVDQLAGRTPSFLLVLRTDEHGGGYAVEYQPSSCGFRFVDEAPDLASYMGGFSCWANDLLALDDGAFEPRVVSTGHVRQWSAAPEILRFDFEREALWPFFHPLRMPERCLRRYREVAREHASARVAVRRRG